MRRILLVFIILILSILPLVADATSATTSMRVSAYKEDPMPDLEYSIKVYYQAVENEITGITQIFDITEKINKETTYMSVGSAFRIDISSTYKNPINVEMYFTPFVNQRDTSKTVPVSYTRTGGFSSVAGSTNVYSSEDRKYMYYRYTPGLVFTDSNNNTIATLNSNNTSATINVTEVGTTVTMTQNIAKIEKRKNRSSGTWSETTVMPSTTGQTIPGFGTTQSLSTVSYFTLQISDDDYNNILEANVDYIATVRLTVSTL